MEAAQIYADIPAPKYRIGQRVFSPSISTVMKSHPCPDCLGTHKWKVTTPAGTEIDVDCHRCGSHTYNDVPSLKYHTWAPSVEALTIGSVRIDTEGGRGGWQDDPVQYMCQETGIGSGSIYSERKLYASEDEARLAAEAMAAAKEDEAAKTPDRIQKKRLSSLHIREAEFDMFKNGLWRSWYCYRDLREKLEDWLKDERSIEDLKWDVEFELDCDKRYADGRQLFERIIIAITKSEDAGLQALIAGLPFKSFADASPDHSEGAA